MLVDFSTFKSQTKAKHGKFHHGHRTAGNFFNLADIKVESKLVKEKDWKGEGWRAPPYR